MNKRTLLILEIIWIVIGIMCIAAAIHNRITGNGDRFLLFTGMGLLAFVMAWLRDRQRKKD